MRKVAFGSLLLILVIIPMPGCASDDDIARAHFPVELRDAGHEPYETKYVTIHPGDGAPRRIVAAYSNNIRAGIRTIDITETGQATPGEVSILDLMLGHVIQMSAKDLDADGAPEVLLKLSSDRCASDTWIFRIEGSTLRSMNPRFDDAEWPICLVDMKDVNGDGVLELFEFVPPLSRVEDETFVPEDPEARASRRILSFGSDLILTELKLAYFSQHYKTRDESTATFDWNDSATGAELIVLNGAGEAAKRASSVRIVLNGQEVVKPSALNQKVNRLVVPVTLLRKNTLTVKVESSPEATIFVYVQPPGSQ
ncbi:MAG: hypothetical protein ACYC7A_14955 [Thermoanaerobaculia bacterium]